MFPIGQTTSEDDGDAFARDMVVHTAIQESSPITSDIYEQLFDSILASELFTEWLQCKDHWQLHVVGGPGSGKTTFAALVAKRLREIISASEEQTFQLANIFINHRNRIENELAFLEDLLDSIYNQVSPPSCDVDPATVLAYSAYKELLRTGQRASKRIDSIAQALRLRTAELARKGDVVLIIDHLDQCSPALRELVQHHFDALQDEGLKILVTSRLPRHEPAMIIWCDYHPQDSPLTVFWRCSKCQQKDICIDCKREDTPCEQCDSVGTWKAPEYYTLTLNGMSDDAMAEYIAWDLEREHGDLGFMTLEDLSEPPLSSFGLAFRNTMQGDKGHEWIQKIARYVDGSILQAKLAVDRIHNLPFPEALDLMPKRIPRNVQAHFNTAIKTIKQQSGADSSSVALKTIAAVGRKGDAVRGLPLSRLANLLRERTRNPRMNIMPSRSPEDVLESANGYLIIIAPPFLGQESTIAAYHRLFWLFVNDEYNEDLIWAYAQLPMSKVPRSHTFQSPLARPLSAFQSSLPSSRRESSDSFKGLGLVFSASPMISPPEETGLDFQ
ncbi:hypothetical protein COCVIDRAFT_101023 [Bipolaris victoriae FI3]|uniref:Nephrocystin 3-like N-terminal domain-containing protein n=1 Tax=Bipolaris victoriae (strain FI3) TaxID=930091 RepID=W7EHM3_BIPV3|nr:hypothetical protein COCVIDRAFT_101023 [Bipolaris victoriae FI3]